MAGRTELLSAPVEQWLKYADARTATAHDYSGQKAEERLALVEDSLDDAIALYRTMSGLTWE